MNTNHHNIDYQYVYFRFDWNWIKDKQIILRGNEDSGILIIADAEGKAVKMYGFERIM
jgi:hypothetical protein